jgi:hypothetical protein
MTTCCDDKPSNGNAVVPPVSWCAGNYTLTYDKGRVVKVPSSSPIENGVYVNPTITMQDGCIVAIEAGTNVLYSACDPCATPAPPPVDGGIAIDGNVCNLSSLSTDGLLTMLFLGPNSCIALSGCGTYTSPLVAAPIISPDSGNAVECRGNGLFVANPNATSGANFNNCGIVIANGLVVTLPFPFEPVLEIVSSDGTVLINRAPANPCLVDLRAIPVDLINIESSRAFQYDNVGLLPNPPVGNGIGVVGTVNPRDVYLFVDNFGWTQLTGVTVTI